MKRFRFFLKSGRSFVVTCDDATFITNDGRLTSFVLEGVTHNNPEFLDANEISAVIVLGKSGDTEGATE